MTIRFRLFSTALLVVLAIVATVIGMPAFHAVWFGSTAFFVLEFIDYLRDPDVDFWVGTEEAAYLILAIVLVISLILAFALASLLFWVGGLVVALPGGAL